MAKRAALLSLCLAFVAVAALASTASARTIPGQYIVVLNDGEDAAAVAADHKRLAKADVLDTYETALDGYAAKLSGSALDEVRSDPRVASVTADEEHVVTQVQTRPPGVRRIDTFASSAFTSTALATESPSVTVNTDVAVYDTGVQTNHPDLNVAGGVNCLTTAVSSRSGNDGTIGDQNGHGTHVAGTLAAKDDSNGVVGVVPGARIWSVRVGDTAGISTTSGQLCGIDWVTANGAAKGIKVVNASTALNGKYDDGNCGFTAGDVLHQAICRSTAAGFLWVFAAGNAASDYHIIPGAGYDEVLTVTAMADNNGMPNLPSTRTFNCVPIGAKKASASETDDNYASFSKYAVRTADFAHTVAAPGACIYSTYKGSGYGTANGTSQAAPHATGVAALCIAQGHCTGTPAETIRKLVADAEAYNQANPGYGFTGDPLRPVSGRYYGFLLRASLY